MLKNLSIKFRLIGGLVILSVLAVCSGVGAIFTVKSIDAGVNTMYVERFRALMSLGQVKSHLLEIRAEVARSTQEHNERDAIVGSMNDVGTAWKTYTSLQQVPSGTGADAEFRRSWQELMAAIMAFETLDDRHGIQALLDQAIAAAAKLTVQQESQAAQAYAQAKSDASLGYTCAAVMSTLSVLTALAIGWSLLRSISRPMRRIIAATQAVAAGDLTQAIEVESKDELGQIAAALKSMQKGLASVMDDLRHTTQVLLPLAENLANGSAALALRNQNQVARLANTSTSMGRLTDTVRQNADNAGKANSLASTAAEVAIRGGAVVDEVVATMGEIDEASSKVVDIITVIDSIAFQTNLLALNAAVEAARAGEQGRGFAVVAGEVRNLAQRSALAAKDIKTLIGQSTGKVQQGRKLVGEAGETIGEVVASVRRVTGMVGDISAASSEQSHGIQQVGEAIVNMNGATRENADLVKQGSQTAAILRDEAQKLSGIVGRFKLDLAARPWPSITATGAARMAMLAGPRDRHNWSDGAPDSMSKDRAVATRDAEE